MDRDGFGYDMVSELVLCAEGRGFETRSRQFKDIQSGICCLIHLRLTRRILVGPESE